MPQVGFKPGSKRDLLYLNMGICCLRPLGHHGQLLDIKKPTMKASIIIFFKTELFFSLLGKRLIHLAESFGKTIKEIES